MMTDENMGERVARAMKERAAQPLKHPARNDRRGPRRAGGWRAFRYAARIVFVLAAFTFAVNAVRYFGASLGFWASPELGDLAIGIAFLGAMSGAISAAIEAHNQRGAGEGR